jgi:hypothetical protein
MMLRLAASVLGSYTVFSLASAAAQPVHAGDGATRLMHTVMRY